MFRWKAQLGQSVKTLILIAVVCGIVAGIVYAARTYHYEGYVGPEGAELERGGNRIVVPAGALSQRTFLSLDVTVYPNYGAIFFDFAPDGLTFAVPVTLSLTYAYLDKLHIPHDDLILYHYRDGEWVEETRAVWDDESQTATFSIDHFSLYYFERR